VFHRAAESGNLEALETLWCWANEAELNPNELLLDQNKEGNTTWQVAAQRDHFEVLYLLSGLVTAVAVFSLIAIKLKLQNISLPVNTIMGISLLYVYKRKKLIEIAECIMLGYVTSYC